MALHVAHMFMPALTETTPWTFQKITYKATEGKMIIFPSWLNHGLETNLSDEELVYISFNIQYDLFDISINLGF